MKLATRTGWATKAACDPLIEFVTDPDLHSDAEVSAYALIARKR